MVRDIYLTLYHLIILMVRFQSRQDPSCLLTLILWAGRDKPDGQHAATKMLCILLSLLHTLATMLVTGSTSVCNSHRTMLEQSRLWVLIDYRQCHKLGVSNPNGTAIACRSSLHFEPHIKEIDTLTFHKFERI